MKDDSEKEAGWAGGAEWVDDKRQTLNTKRETGAKTLARNDSSKMQDGYSAYSSIFQLYQQEQAEKRKQQMTACVASMQTARTVIERGTEMENVGWEEDPELI